MKGDHMGTGPTNPSPRELSLSNQTRFRLEQKALKLTGGPSSLPPPATRSVYAALIADGQADLFLTYCTNARTAALGCLVPGFDGALFSSEWKDALWAQFCMGAPARRRQCVERSSIVKRA